MKVTLFNQLMQALPRGPFQKIVGQRNSDKASKGINSWTHLVSMLFCHLGNAGSVRDIANGLRSMGGNAVHLGLGKVPCKSSISYINSHRTWEVFQDYYFALLDHFDQQTRFQRPKLRKIKRQIFILDSSTVSLTLSLFDWAVFRKRKGGLKLHTVLDYDGCLPVYCHVTEARKHDAVAARMIDFPAGSVILFDRGYIDYGWMSLLDSKGSFFVTRAKDNMAYEIETVKHEDSLSSGVRRDAIIRLTRHYAKRNYPGKLRLVRFWDAEQGRELEFLTNNLSWTAQTICDMYKERWHIETFFKNIKQRLRIKTFVGTSQNAVMIQVWTALIAYLVLQFLKTRAQFGWNLSNLVTFLRLNLFVKIDLWLWLNDPFSDKGPPELQQLSLF